MLMFVYQLLCEDTSTETIYCNLTLLQSNQSINRRQFPINYQSTVASTSPKDMPFSPPHDQSFNHDTRQEYNTSGNERQDDGAMFGLKIPMDFSAPTSPKDKSFSPTNDQFFNHDTRQDYNTSGTERQDNGVNFGLKKPMEFSPKNTCTPNNNAFSPRNNNSTFSPRSNANTFSPTNSINKFSPRNNNGFSPTNSTLSPSNTPNRTARAPDKNYSNTNHNADWDVSTESLARRQLIAEINETKFLMRDSVTPDAINFWKKHLEELDQRLVALSLEEQLKAADGSTEVPNTKVNVCTMLPDLQSQEEGHFNIIGGDSIGWICQPSSPNDDQLNMIADSHNVEITPYTPRNEMPVRDMPVCDVVAPSDLPGGYMFEAQLGSKKFLATVPPGGVLKNQIFTSTVGEVESIEIIQIIVPLGAWRDGAMDCFTDGVFHSLFLNALFVPCSEFLFYYVLCLRTK